MSELVLKINQEVEEYRALHVLKLYKDHPDEIERDLIRENETKDDYEGREVLELIQNAVDEIEEGGKIFIGLVNNILTVANTGTHFDFDGVKSLMKSNLSKKREKKNTIGQKGLGFRAILNWSNEISIFSGDLSIRFSEKFRRDFFETENVKEQTAILVAPEIIENIDKHGFDTIIKIKLLNGQIIEEVKRQINSIDKYTLLFLNKVNELTVKIEEQETKFKRESYENVVTILENDHEFIFETYSKKGKINDKYYEIVIAYDETIIPKENKLYSFFETSINFPIKWKCHATFDLDANRNGIKKSEDNLKLLSELAAFICEKAIELGNNLNFYEGFDSITKSGDFPASLVIKGNDFNDTFHRFFENTKVLPTYSTKKVSLNDRPIFYKDIPFFLKNKNIDSILVESQNSIRNAIIEKYSKKIVDKTLADIINSYSLNWTAAQNIEVFLWWNKEFSYSNVLPNVIKSQDGEFIDSNSIVYFVRGRNLNIPSWSKINQLDPNFEAELKKQLTEIQSFLNELETESIIERVIARNSGRPKQSNDIKLIPHIQFRDADASSILTPVNSSVEGNYNYAISFLKWLWENYSEKEDWAAPLDISFNFPSSKKTVEKASNLYFNDKYGNPLGSKLFISEKKVPFLSYEEIGIDEVDIYKFKKFIQKFGVLEFPPLMKSGVSDTTFRKFFDEKYLLSKLSGYELNAREPYLTSFIFNVIDNLEVILSSLDILEIFKWIINDSVLNDELDLRHYSSISFNYRASVQAYRTHTFIDYSKSYVRYIFSNTEWLLIDGVKYKPRQCVFAYTGLDVSRVVPTITNKFIQEYSKSLSISQKEMRDFLTKLGVNNSIVELDSELFYGVLLTLPKLDESGQISEKIYREIIDMDGEIDTNSLNYYKFLKSGFVFTQNHDGKQFHLATDSYFSSSIQVNLGNYHIMRTPLKNGSLEVFQRIFGVKKFEEMYTVESTSIILHHENDKFQNYFKEFIKYAWAWGERNDRIKKRIDNIQIQIVSQVILVNNNEGKLISNDYMLISNKNSWLIFVSENKNTDYRQISKCIEEVFAQVGNTTNSEIINQLGELFRSPEDRRFLVEKYFGSINAINEIYQNQIRLNLADSLKIPYDSEELNEINFDSFESAENRKPLIKLLLRYNKNVNELKDDGFEYGSLIDFRPLHLQLIKDYIGREKINYLNSLYTDFLDKSFSEKKAFLLIYQNFSNPNLSVGDLENSIFFDVENKILELFPDFKIRSNEINAGDIFNKNYGDISRTFDAQLFDEFIQGNMELKSLIYFLDDQISKIIKKEYLKKNIIGNNEDNNESETETESTLVKSTIKPVLLEQDEQHSSRGRGNSKGSIEKQNKNKQKNGKRAEEKVRNKLISIIPTLRWTSENSDIPSEREGTAKYDMVYIKDGKECFIEVKAATDVFFMSIYEYRFARDNVENYELYLVDLDKDIIDGPHSLSEFETSKEATMFQFSFTSE